GVGVGNVVELRGRRRVPPLVVRGTDLADLGGDAGVERVGEAALADAGVPDEGDRLAGEDAAQLVDAALGDGGAADDGDAEAFVRLELGEFGRALVGGQLVQQVDLVQ